MPASVPIDADLPLKLTVDLQSRHATLWRLFTRPDLASDWTFLKEGSEDGATTIASMPVGGAMLAEFVYLPDPQHGFKAVLVFEQKGAVVATEQFGAPGDQIVLQEEVEFT